MKSQKILLVLTDAGLGGITTAACNMCKDLVRRNHHVDVLIMDDDSPSPENLPEKIKVFRLQGKAKLWNLGMPKIKREKNLIKKIFLIIMSVMKKLLNSSDKWKRFVFSSKKMFSGYDAVFAYRQNSSCYYFVTHCCASEKKVAFVHGDVNFMMGNEASFVKYMPMFDVVAYVSEGVRQGFITKYPELLKNSATVYNFFDSEDILFKSHQKCDIDFDSEKVNIVTVSRLEDITKGIHRICPVCKALNDRFSGKFHWYVVGDGKELEKCLADRHALGLDSVIDFIGKRDNPYPFLKAADIAVLPSRTEAFPMVVCESLVLGVPVVVCRYPAAVEQITQGVNGVIAEQDEKSIADVLCDILQNDTLLMLKKNAAQYRYDNGVPYKQLMQSIQ